MSIIPSPCFYIWPDKLHLASLDAKKGLPHAQGVAAARSDSPPGTARQASRRSPGGRSIPSMVYLCIHIGGEREWSLPSIVASLNIFRKPSIVSASFVLGSINSEMWPSVFSLVRICAINTRRTASWMPGGMISHSIKCHVRRNAWRRSAGSHWSFFVRQRSTPCAGVICQVKL